METRKNQVLKKNTASSAPLQKTGLPKEFLQMVEEVFEQNFHEPVQKHKADHGIQLRFQTDGQIYQNEAVLCISLQAEDHIAATTIWASVDFDPKATHPTLQDVLNDCVDGVGSLFQDLFEQYPEDLLLAPLTALEQAPYDWTEFEINKRKIYLKIDKTNPKIDQLTNEWLNKHDPKFSDIESLDEIDESEFIDIPEVDAEEDERVAKLRKAEAFIRDLHADDNDDGKKEEE